MDFENMYFVACIQQGQPQITFARLSYHRVTQHQQWCATPITSKTQAHKYPSSPAARGVEAVRAVVSLAVGPATYLLVYSKRFSTTVGYSGQWGGGRFGLQSEKRDSGQEIGVPSCFKLSYSGLSSTIPPPYLPDRVCLSIHLLLSDAATGYNTGLCLLA